jgi:hypothetical protein
MGSGFDGGGGRMKKINLVLVLMITFALFVCVCDVASAKT